MDIKQFDLGEVTLEDVKYAEASNLAIVNFNQKIKQNVANDIKNNKVKLYDFDIIYRNSLIN